MLGIADRTKVLSLLEFVFEGLKKLFEDALSATTAIGKPKTKAIED